MASDPTSSDDTTLQIAGSWLEALSDGSKEVIALLDETGRVVYLHMGDAVEELIGFSAMDLMGMTAGDLLEPEDHRRVLEAVRDVVGHPGSRLSVTYQARHAEGHFVELQSTAVNRLNQEYVDAVVVHTRAWRDPSDHPPDSDPPVHSSPPPPRITDDAGFTTAVNDALQRAQLEDYAFSVMLIGLGKDRGLFDRDDDLFADSLRRRVGRRLEALLRPDDILAQLKDHRIAILLSGVNDKRQAERVAGRVQKTLSQPLEVRGETVQLTPMIGIATSERLYQRATDVMRDAEVAATTAGDHHAKGRSVFRTSMQVQHTRHMSMVTELHQGVEAGQFKLYYQPIISLPTRTLSGFEALLRWDHPGRGIVTPGVFLPLAEQCGVIRPLGAWILDEACRQLADWQRRYKMDPPLYVSVNLAAKQAADPGLPDYIDQVLRDHEVDSGQLTVEITEAAVIENREAVTNTLHRLKINGVRISRDNFGAGTSSLGNLHTIPYDLLSIDQQLIADMNSASSNRELIRAIIGLAHNLAMEVIAVGIEKPGQAAQLADMMCEYAQGYLFGKPLGPDATDALIASYPQWWGK